MNYEPISLYLQDYINVVWAFQNGLLPELEEIKARVEYRDYSKHDLPRSVASYNKLLRSVIYKTTIEYNEISRPAIYLLDKNINRYRFFYPRTMIKKGLLKTFSENENENENEKYPNKIVLPGYIINEEELSDARKSLFQILSVDEKYRLIYEPEMIRKNFFVIFRQVY